MQFHEILNKQKFICFAHREHEKKKKRTSRDLKELEIKNGLNNLL